MTICVLLYEELHKKIYLYHLASIGNSSAVNIFETIVILIESIKFFCRNVYLIDCCNTIGSKNLVLKNV